MSSKITIEVFGLRNESVNGGGCCDGGCGPGGCGPAPTMGEMYQELVEFMEQSELKDKVALQFIDVMADNLDGYESVKKVLDKGLGLPVTAINGKAIFYGGLSVPKIYDEVKKI
ncbi:hypothetical protein [Anaeroselena agilis]|uniref:Arsenical resistance operon trans-acting repressor ArsD n=1 Tax=Anaeroselena agilis TaxID=3063788 RepID=A0ABU3NTZ8_9FIRM|nr:hypothetical protein [Selenomonadales bacterium 4137-cl]